MSVKSDLAVVENLFKHDLAACEIYKDVLKHITSKDVHAEIKGFLHDHEVHVKNWKRIIKDMDGKEPDNNATLKGLLMEAYAAVRSITGEGGALKALQTAENDIVEQYKRAAKETLPDEVMEIVKNQLEDEKRHSAYVNKHVQK